MNPLDEVLTREQQVLLKKALLDAGQGKTGEFGFVWLEVNQGQVRNIFGGRSYDSSPGALSAVMGAVSPVSKRRRRSG